jgi:hypothetical protein
VRVLSQGGRWRPLDRAERAEAALAKKTNDAKLLLEGLTMEATALEAANARIKHMETVLYDAQVLLGTEDIGELITGPDGPISRLIARAERAEAERDAMREALDNSQSLLVALLVEPRVPSEIEKQIVENRAALQQPSPAAPTDRIAGGE